MYCIYERKIEGTDIQESKLQVKFAHPLPSPILAHITSLVRAWCVTWRDVTT